MKRFLLLLFLSGLSAVSPSWCQNPNTPWLPVGLNGETGPVSTMGESEENELSMGVSVSGGYYGAASSNSGQENLGSFSVAPDIAITENRPRMSGSLRYSPSYADTQQSGTMLLQNLLGVLQFRITEKLTLQVGERYLRTNSWFTGLDTNPAASPGNVIQQPNQSVLTTETLMANSFTNLNLIYQSSESTVAGFGGSFSTGNFSNQVAALNQPLFNNNSGTVSTYVQHRMQGKNWLGTTGTFQRIVTTGGIKEGADNASVQIFYTFAPSSQTSLSVFAGPSYFTSQAETELVLIIFGIPVTIPITIPSKGWGANGGATAGWRTQRTGVSASYIHRISDGGGLTGATRSDSGSANFRHQISEHCTANAMLLYGRNNSVSVLYGGSFRRITGTASLNWTLTKNLTAVLTYARDQVSDAYSAMDGVGSPTAVTTHFDSNRAWVSLSYHITRPLGR